MGIVEIKLVEDYTPTNAAELVDYLRTMACVHPERGTRQMPTKTDDAVFDMAADTIERIQEALTPSGETKAAYIGEFSFGLDYVDEFGDECTRNVVVPWTTVKEIMAAIRARAGMMEVA